MQVSTDQTKSVTFSYGALNRLYILIIVCFGVAALTFISGRQIKISQATVPSD